MHAYIHACIHQHSFKLTTNHGGMQMKHTYKHTYIHTYMHTYINTVSSWQSNMVVWGWNIRLAGLQLHTHKTERHFRAAAIHDGYVGPMCVYIHMCTYIHAYILRGCNLWCICQTYMVQTYECAYVCLGTFLTLRRRVGHQLHAYKTDRHFRAAAIYDGYVGPMCVCIHICTYIHAYILRGCNLWWICRTYM